MSTHKRIDVICIAVIICGLILTVLFMNGEALGIQKIVDEDSPYYQGEGYFSSNDRNGSYEEDEVEAVITLEKDTASVSGNGAYVLEGDVYITGAGKYLVTGTLTDGRIIIDAYSSSKVWLILQGADISCADDAAIIVEQAEKVFLTLAEGTENVVTGADSYNDQAVEEEHTGAIFSRDDLTINGSGSLTVSAGYMHGIVSKDDLVIAGGNITVTAAKDALKANKNIGIAGSQICLTAGDDGLMVNKDEGVLYVESGSIEIVSGGDGVNSLGDVMIAGGELTIDAGDDGIHSDAQISVTGGTILIRQCYEGLEAVTVDISGGEITVYPTDDGINANGGSGDFFGMGGGPGMDGRQENAEGESDGRAPGGRSAGEESDGESAGEESPGESPGQSPGEQASPSESESMKTVSEDSWVRISGGVLTIINENGNDADGIDSNGDIYITGGTIRISLIGNGMNCAIDYGSESGGICEISGGVIAAAGGSGMNEPFSDSSTQCSVLYHCSEPTDPDTTVRVLNEEGAELLCYEVPCSFSSIYLSFPEMVQGGTYTVIVGEEETEITTDSVSFIYGTAADDSFAGPGGRMSPGGRMDSGDSEGVRQEAAEEPAESTEPQQ